MSPSHSRNRFGACYRYYISQAFIKSKPHEAGTISKILAKEIEDFVILKITELLKNKKLILEYTNDFPIKKQNKILTFLETYTPDQVFIRTIIHKVTIYENKIKIILDKELLIKSIEAVAYKQLLNFKSNSENLITYDYDVKLSPAPQRGTKIVIGHNKVEYNLTLIQALTKSFYYNKLVEEGRLPKEFGNSSYIHRLMRLRFLPPDIIEAILNGTQDRNLTLKQLYAMSKI